MVIPGNLPSQLCVLDSLATPHPSVLSFLFKFPTLFPSKPPEKLLLSLTMLSPPPPFFLWCLLLQATLLPSYSPVSKHGLPNHSPCCCRHQALSFMAARPIWPGFMVREGGSPSHFQRITAKLHSNSPKTLLNPPTGVSTLLQLQKVRLIPYGY